MKKTTMTWMIAMIVGVMITIAVSEVSKWGSLACMSIVSVSAALTIPRNVKLFIADKMLDAVSMND